MVWTFLCFLQTSMDSLQCDNHQTFYHWFYLLCCAKFSWNQNCHRRFLHVVHVMPRAGSEHPPAIEHAKQGPCDEDQSWHAHCEATRITSWPIVTSSQRCIGDSSSCSHHACDVFTWWAIRATWRIFIWRQDIHQMQHTAGILILFIVRVVQVGEHLLQQRFALLVLCNSCLILIGSC